MAQLEKTLLLPSSLKPVSAGWDYLRVNGVVAAFDRTSLLFPTAHLLRHSLFDDKGARRARPLSQQLPGSFRHKGLSALLEPRENFSSLPRIALGRRTRCRSSAKLAREHPAGPRVLLQPGA